VGVSNGKKNSLRTLTQTPPNISVVAVELENVLEILNGFVELLLRPEDAAYGVHGRNGSRIGTQSVFIRNHSFVEIAQKLCKTPCTVVSVMNAWE
jgi:hypothetical protein